MTQFHWDLIGYGVWALIIWMTVKQFLQTRSPVKGNGLRLLLGDWLLFAPVPWIVYMLHNTIRKPHIILMRFFVLSFLSIYISQVLSSSVCLPKPIR